MARKGSPILALVSKRFGFAYNQTKAMQSEPEAVADGR